MSELNSVLQENIRITAQVITEICQRNTRKQVGDQPLTRNQCYILKILATSGDFLISELARILEISVAATSKIIDRLEQQEMVERQAHTEDRRSLVVKLLPKGRLLVEEIHKISTQKMVPVMAQFSEEEKIQLLGFLKRIVQFTLADENNTDLLCLQCGGRCGEECLVQASKGVCARPEKTKRS